MMKKGLLNFMLLLTPFFLLAQWNQLGSSIQGEAEGDLFGHSTSINSEGNVMVSGAYHNDENGYLSGHAKVYEWDGIDWVQRGSNIKGMAEEWSGFRVAIDSSGNTVAVTSIYGDNVDGFSPGLVRIFDWDGNDWVQRGADIIGVGHPVILEWFGSGLTLSADGNTIAIGGPNFVGTQGKAGFVRIFKWDGNEWTQLGIDLTGNENFDDFGYSLDLNNAGDILAVGAQGTFGFGNNQEGYIETYKWNGTDWVQHGSRIKGELNGDEFGRSVSLSASGDVLAVGAPGYEILPANLSSETYVYGWSGTDWVQRGDKLVGEEDINRFGAAVSLNANGNILAVGTSYFSSKGNIQIFEWINDAWTQIEENIQGEELQDIFGASLDLNASGNTVAGGAWGNGIGGQVRMFKNEMVVGVKTTDLNPTLIQIYPNPSNGILNLTDVTERIELSLVDLNGRVLLERVIENDATIDLTSLPAGVYFLKTQTDKTIQSEMLVKQ